MNVSLLSYSLPLPAWSLQGVWFAGKSTKEAIETHLGGLVGGSFLVWEGVVEESADERTVCAASLLGVPCMWRHSAHRLCASAASQCMASPRKGLAAENEI